MADPSDRRKGPRSKREGSRGCLCIFCCGMPVLCHERKAEKAMATLYSLMGFSVWMVQSDSKAKSVGLCV